ncbi:hypothetical protein AZE42_10797 [Rhizopogon vesiculosus]|uniref:Uncharacterized protein n=1 Tax=Rhizopogon vesiculosus TaxID=180088 RepID=A0A1J8QK46_9AGAM|nr:hypothetical protein AZE42_10797 [Rhizopogon vesiculosus]
MSLTQSGVQNMSATYQEPEGLERLGIKQSSNSLTPSSESDPPDGGIQAWTTAFGCFLMQFCGYGYLISFGVYQVHKRAGKTSTHESI